ncbi:MAG: FAD-dependent oxidoreductase [Flavisolibacter sp.]|nr:FAD-dependent oxidoreductase [Flavisolibacter sp.]
MRKKSTCISFLFLLFFIKTFSQSPQQYDICIYGGTAAGVMAAYTAKMMGKSVLLIEPGKHVGGLTTGGLGYTDIGNKYAITGLALDFYRRIGKHYGKFEQWIFEPHVAEAILMDYINRSKATVLLNHRLYSVRKDGGYIKNIVIENSEQPQTASNKTINARMFIDCTYEGDLMAKAGVSYFIGREANSLYGETYNGVQLLDQHQFPDGVDPYKTPGDPSSGLLWGISPEPLQPQGTGDKKVQAYNFRICLSNKEENRIPITQPEGYDPSIYELLPRYLEKKKPVNLNDRVLKIDLMPNNKTDINNNGPFSTDMIGMNYNYPEADYATRQQITKAHENYIKGLLYFLGHDERVPQHLRTEMLQWGYPKDEYTDNGHWSPQMYVREARRMKGVYVMTQHNCEGREVVQDGVGMAAYTMDSHNCQRIVVNGMVKNEGDVQKGGFGPYPISYRSLTPKATECKNLLVPVCLSATHIAYGSIRMEPVFMVLAQSSAVAAAFAIDAMKPVQEVDVKKVQQFLKANPLIDGSLPDLVVDDADSKNIIVNGVWRKETSGSYGRSKLVADANNGGGGFIQFNAPVTISSGYAIYTYFPKPSNTADETIIQIYDGKKMHDTTIKAADIAVAGQTSGEWVHLGDYRIEKGSNPYVRILNTGTNGVVTADAVLWKLITAKK